MKPEQVLAACREDDRRLRALFGRGVLTAEELLSRRCERLLRARQELSGAVLSEDELAAACGLRRVAVQWEQPDLSFDRLADGGLYVFRGLAGAGAVLCAPERAGCTFQMELPLPAGGKTVWRSYRFTVDSSGAGSGAFLGWESLAGHGRFPGYSGEATLCLWEEGGAVQSVLYQKCYIDWEDPL